MEAGLMVKQLGKDYQFFLIGHPRMYADFPTIVFLNPDHPGSDIMTETVGTLELSPHQKAVFFAIPENHLLLEGIEKKYPGGRQGFVNRKPKPEEVLFEYYILDR